MVRSPILLTLAMVLTAATGVARADDADEAKAKEIADRALTAASEGFSSNDSTKLEEAIRLYKQAFAVDPNPLYQCNAGVAYKLLADLPRAHALLAMCLQRLPAVQASAVAKFRVRLDEVEAALPEQHVAVDVITAPPGATLSVSTLGQDEHLVAPTVVWLPAGTHTISATATGYERTTETVTIAAVDVAGHAKKRVRLSLPTAVVEPAAVITTPPVEPPVPVAASNRGRRTAGKVTLGAGALLLAAGGVMHAVTANTRGDLDGLSGDAYDEKLPTFETQRNLTVGLYAVGGVAAITGVVLLAISPSHADRVSIAPAPSGQGAMVWLDLSP